jgi:hypothetical protein
LKSRSGYGKASQRCGAFSFIKIVFYNLYCALGSEPNNEFFGKDATRDLLLGSNLKLPAKFHQVL